MSVAVDRVVNRVEGTKPTAIGWTARCPAHEDTINSLSISEGSDGRCLINCHAGCSTSSILEAIGLKVVDLFDDGGSNKFKGQFPTAVYTYTDVSGVVLYEVLRYPPKDFRQRRPDPAVQGGWLPNLIGVSPVPYRLPDLQNQKTVVIVEGEKDVDRLWSLGIPATCNNGGALKWKQPQTAALRSAGCQRVIILPDNDDPGREHAERVAVLCKKAGMSVSVCELPGLGPHGDVSDWLDAGHSVDDLKAVIDKPYVIGAAAQPTIIEEVADSDAFNPLAFKKTDLGNAEAFLAQFGDVVRYDRASEDWLIWSGHTWQRRAQAQVRCLAHEHVRKWQQAAVEWRGYTDYAQKKELMDYTLKLERSAAFDSLLKEARVKPTVSIAGGWDENPWLLGTQTGIVDLQTGEHREGQPADMVTHVVGVAYEPTATAPRWVEFLHQVFGGDEDVVAYVQRAVGYCLTGITSEQCFFMAFGTGANGKSTFLTTLDAVLGAYAHTTDIRTFTHSGDGVSYEMAMLAGKRMIATSEAKTRSQLNEQALKNFTGGERIEAQHKYGHPFTFKPTGKIWFAVNHQPRVNDESHGFWRRVRLVPFTQTFTGREEDRTLGDKLKAEGPGILQWAIEGTRLWREHGLQPPAAVVAATEAYKEAEDPILEFLHEKCNVGSADIHKARAGDLYQAYVKWAKGNGIDKEMLNHKEFGLYIKRSFSWDRGATGVVYLGVSIREDRFPDL
jgi:putative DNA primase/helicase